MNIIRKFVQLIRASKQFYKYGGISTVKIATIDYGSIFKDKTILITGGNSGIGKSICERFLANGANVIITGRNIEKLNKVAADLNNSRLKILSWDLSDTNNIKEVVKKLETDYKIDILINNAGVYSKTSFPNCTSEDWDNVYTTNVKATFFICQEFCNLWMLNRKAEIRKIINISSQGGFTIANNPYRMTKWDIRGFTSYLGAAMTKHGIIANAIAPGIIQTDMQPSFQKQGENLFTHLNPANRIGLPIEIAELAVFLASDAANFIIGQTICCDGGYTIK